MNNMDWINYYAYFWAGFSLLFLLLSPGDVEVKHWHRVLGLLIYIPVYGRAMGLW